MPRIGQNPIKWLKEVYQPKLVTLCTMVHIPALEGYWEQSLEVLDRCLTSMVSTAGPSAELMVLDNGSCREVCSYLQKKKEAGLISYLLLSRHNLGKVGAWNILFLGAPGEYLAYTDSDVLFFNGWLERSLEVFRAFPKAGMVTAQPIAGGDQSSLWTGQEAAADKTIQMDAGLLISHQYLQAHLKGINADEKEHAHRQINRKDVRLTRAGISAYATASHFQFLTRKDVVNRFFPSKAVVPLGGDNQFDVDMQEHHLWRLSTTEYLVHHMGNRIPDLLDEVPWIANPAGGSIPKKDTASRLSKAVGIQNPMARRILKRINSWTYRLLYG